MKTAVHVIAWGSAFGAVLMMILAVLLVFHGTLLTAVLGCAALWFSTGMVALSGLAFHAVDC